MLTVLRDCPDGFDISPEPLERGASRARKLCNKSLWNQAGHGKLGSC